MPRASQRVEASMSEPGPQSKLDDATVDLLIKQVTEGLSPEEQRALDVLDSAVASANLREFERAAAAIALAGSAHAQPLPAALAQRLASQADEHFAAIADAAHGATAGADSISDDSIVNLAAARSAATPALPRAASRGGAYGWLAAAACLVLAVFAWNRSPPPAPVAAVPTPPV